MPIDIRDKTFISHDDVVGLNFVNASSPYVFRRHYRQGLRSHILEVLRREDVERERTGCVVEGTRWYPRAKPLKMFRIFRARLKTLNHALTEINRVKITERYLGPAYMARSSEFIVDYAGPEGPDPLLCGFQEYEQGAVVDPWSVVGPQAFVAALYDGIGPDGPDMGRHRWATVVRERAGKFVHRIKRMIDQAGYVPDLAGIGNLLVTPAGNVKLVDINNISKVVFDSQIRLDDRGYPVCDKSIEALYLIEEKMVGTTPDKEKGIYRGFLEPGRARRVKAYEAVFYSKIKENRGYPALRRTST